MKTEENPTSQDIKTRKNPWFSFKSKDFCGDNQDRTADLLNAIAHEVKTQ
jgi:hypothetical protein